MHYLDRPGGGWAGRGRGRARVGPRGGTASTTRATPNNHMHNHAPNVLCTLQAQSAGVELHMRSRGEVAMSTSPHTSGRSRSRRTR